MLCEKLYLNCISVVDYLPSSSYIGAKIHFCLGEHTNVMFGVDSVVHCNNDISFRNAAYHDILVMQLSS